MWDPRRWRPRGLETQEVETRGAGGRAVEGWAGGALAGRQRARGRFLSPLFIPTDTTFSFPLLGREVVDVQGDLPAVGALADLGDAAAELAAQRPAVGRARRRHQGALPGQQTEIPGPGAAARPLVPVLGDVGHPEGLVEEAAAVVPVAEGLPAGAAEEGEGHAALSHDARGWGEVVQTPSSGGRGGQWGYKGGVGLGGGQWGPMGLIEANRGHGVGRG
uniref:Uncharacterized protein n=1 Tax=Cairina moschata TaxID=8855 RepID=A0A8C3GQB1_CAIMO